MNIGLRAVCPSSTRKESIPGCLAVTPMTSFPRHVTDRTTEAIFFVWVIYARSAFLLQSIPLVIFTLCRLSNVTICRSAHGGRHCREKSVKFPLQKSHRSGISETRCGFSAERHSELRQLRLPSSHDRFFSSLCSFWSYVGLPSSTTSELFRLVSSIEN